MMENLSNDLDIRCGRIGKVIRIVACNAYTFVDITKQKEWHGAQQNKHPYENNA